MLSPRSALPSLTALAMLVPASLAQWQPGPSMPAAKAFAAGAAVGDDIYAIGGEPWSGGDMDPTVYRLTGGALVGTWSTLAPIDGVGALVQMAAGVDAQGRLLFSGGLALQNDDVGPTRLYDPVEGTGASFADPPDLIGLNWFGWVSDSNGHLVRAGGEAKGDVLTGFVARLDPIADAWTELPTLPIPVREPAVAMNATGALLVIGGERTSGATAIVQSLAPGATAWSTDSLPPLPEPRSGARAILGDDDRVYVIGGRNASGVTQSAVFALHPQQASWSVEPSMSTPRVDFAVALSADSRIIVMGGHDSSGASLSSVESLYTPSCPVIAAPAADIVVWMGSPLTINADAGGGAPLSFQWFLDGVALADGPHGAGQIVGAQGATLRVTVTQPSDAGIYSVRVWNDCGEVLADRATVNLTPSPEVPTQWVIESLHPAGTLASSATCIRNGVVGGSFRTPHPDYGQLDQAAVWLPDSTTAQMFTPASSVGAGILDLDGTTAVGWWWWPYQCWYSGAWHTCYSRQAAKWDIATGTHTNLQVSGWEYSHATCIDNGIIGGTASTDDAVGNTWSHAMIWGWGSQWARDVHPANSLHSSIADIDGNVLVGSRNTPNPGTVTHAMRWDITPSLTWTGTDLDPGSMWDASGAVCVEGDLVVGRTGYPYDQGRAAIWNSTPESWGDIHPAAATLSGTSLIRRGLVFGWATIGGATLTGRFELATDEFIPLEGLESGGYSTPSIADLEIGDDGSFTFVGSAYNIAAARYEAVRWRGLPNTTVQGDLNGDGVVNAADLALLLGAWGAAGGAAGAADLNADGTVNAADLAILLSVWG